MGADVYENWTDVSGFLMADPKIVDNPKPIRSISYMELRELSYMGASVMHEDAVNPLKVVNIPINIRNTNDPQNPGTIITAEHDKDDDRIITGIAGSKDFTQKAKSGAWKKELENASARIHIQRLEALQLQVKNSIETLKNKENEMLEDYLIKNYEDTYYHSLYEISKGLNLKTSFATLDKNKINQV